MALFKKVVMACMVLQAAMVIQAFDNVEQISVMGIGQGFEGVEGMYYPGKNEIVFFDNRSKVVDPARITFVGIKMFFAGPSGTAYSYDYPKTMDGVALLAKSRIAAPGAPATYFYGISLHDRMNLIVDAVKKTEPMTLDIAFGGFHPYRRGQGMIPVGEPIPMHE